jgi:Mn-dependent DtxR family transcriptional regulator
VNTGQIAQAMGAKSMTTIERLRRLEDKGLVSGGRSGGWTATA